jgi:hypothetical protein
MNEEQILEDHKHDENGCVCHDHTEDSHPHGCAGHHHGPPLQDTSGPRLLATLALNLIIPTAQIFASIPMVQLLIMAEFFYFSSRLKVLWGDKDGAQDTDL